MQEVLSSKSSWIDACKCTFQTVDSRGKALMSIVVELIDEEAELFASFDFSWLLAKV